MQKSVRAIILSVEHESVLRHNLGIVNTVIADTKGRIKLPEGTAPGDRFAVSIDSQGRIIYRKLSPEPRDLENVPLAKVTNGKDGLPVVKMPGATNATIARLVRDERDSR